MEKDSMTMIDASDNPSTMNEETVERGAVTRPTLTERMKKNEKRIFVCAMVSIMFILSGLFLTIALVSMNVHHGASANGQTPPTSAASDNPLRTPHRWQPFLAKGRRDTAPVILELTSVEVNRTAARLARRTSSTGGGHRYGLSSIRDEDKVNN